MVRDFPNFYYGEVQHDAPFPYPHKGLMSEDGLQPPRRLRHRRQGGAGLRLRHSRSMPARAICRIDALRFAKAVEHLHLMWIEDMITGDYVPYVNPDVYREVTRTRRRRSTPASRSTCARTTRR